MIRLPLIKTFNLSNGFHNSGVSQISTLAYPLQFRVTPALCATPMKKKKKMDPNVIKAREERKKKRIEKEIRKLSKLDKTLKPIYEFEVPYCLKDDLERRTRNVTISDAEANERIVILKDWSKYKYCQAKNNKRELLRIMEAQKNALSELRLESEELYQAAVKIDDNLIPLKFKGPSETPPKKDYHIPDGMYKDVSRKWNK